MVIISLFLLITGSYTDLRERGISIVPIAASLISCIALMIGVRIFGERYGFVNRWLIYEPGAVNIVLGLVPGFLLMAVSRITREAIGMGDVYVTLVLGLMLGLENICFVLFIATAFTGISGLFLMGIRGKDKKDTLPFMPFMLASFVVFWMYKMEVL